MKRDYSKVFAACKTIRREYKDVVDEFTKGRHCSLRQLTDKEFGDLEMLLKEMTGRVRPGNSQRQKMFAIATKMKWGKDARERNQAIDDWLMKQKYGKPLMQLTLDELNRSLYIFETKVYKDYLKGLNK
ncbi:hypothetical protein AB6735_18610 [Mucilaginibacter sp. RCC_168]|uniref:hypothetical protein n=1 Tax=Mucilaginibacter sp. RCC_168 TaxID=3239221 RepID=UPI003524B1B5